MPVAVTDEGGTILVDDGNMQWYIKKQKVAVTAQGTNVLIRGDQVHYVTYPASTFTAPTGTASAIATAIEAFLDAN